jgi:hypothetical protein
VAGFTADRDEKTCSIQVTAARTAKVEKCPVITHLVP